MCVYRASLFSPAPGAGASHPTQQTGEGTGTKLTTGTGTAAAVLYINDISSRFLELFSFRVGSSLADSDQLRSIGEYS